MGKLAPAYLDTVLTWKLKTLIQGAIERQKLESIPKSEDAEPTEPTITYERFVDALSVRDSFTATIIELLVKELADRQTRARPHESSFISENTRKTLRRLSTHYTERATRRSPGSRPPIPGSSFLDHLEDDSTEYQNMVYNSSVEGAQIDSNLYEAFSSSEHTWPAPILHSALVTNRDDSPPFLPPPRSPPVSTRPGSNPWTSHSAVLLTSGSSLSRQPSIRRPFRPPLPTQHFRDFTSRRRSSSRLMNEAEEGRRSPSDEESPRLSARRSLRPIVPVSEIVLQPTGLPTPAASSPLTSSPEVADDEPESNPPPRLLRRGGLRAPETLLYQQMPPSSLPINVSETPPISQNL